MCDAEIKQKQQQQQGEKITRQEHQKSNWAAVGIRVYCSTSKERGVFFPFPKLFFTIDCHCLQIVLKLGVVDLAEGGKKEKIIV